MVSERGREGVRSVIRCNFIDTAADERKSENK